VYLQVAGSCETFLEATVCICRLQAHVAQSSSSQGRLEQQLSERDALIRERDVKIESLEKKLVDTQTNADSLTCRLNEQELVMIGKDRRINELNALIGDRSRSDVTTHVDGTLCVSRQ